LSKSSIYAENVFRLFTQGGARFYRETANNIIPNTAAGIVQPIVQPAIDNVTLPHLRGGLGIGIVSPPRIRGGVGWNPFLLLDLIFGSSGRGGGGGSGVTCYFNGVWQPCVPQKNKIKNKN